MLVELGLGLLEQRHKGVLEVLGGASVTDVACRRVARQTLHDWPRRYKEARDPGLSDPQLQPRM